MRTPDAPLLLADTQALTRAAELLVRGGVIAFPTDTVYGLACDLFNPQAIARVYAIKGRPAHLPLIAMIADADQWELVAAALPGAARTLIQRWWPGPLTLILPARADVPPEALNRGVTIGVRIPNHPVARALLRQAGRPLATTSANLSGQQSPQTARAVAEQLHNTVDLILDDGPSPFGSASTIVDCTTDPLTILRDGPITREMLGL